MGATGLATSPTQYRQRLHEQTDDQIDAWAEELLRDVAVRRGVARVIADIQHAARLDDRVLARVFGRGGGPAQSVGRDAEGRIVVPSIALHCLVKGLRAEAPDARERLIDFLAAGFDEIVFV